jgi:SOS response regulatory protein OraA/RecX
VQVAVYGRRPLIDPERFAETVAVNRGAKVKVSEQLDEALAWLGVSASC